MYLYGDCTDSRLDSNFLGVLPEALDYCVRTLLADERIERGRAECLEVEREATNEVTCLRALSSGLKEALARAPRGAEGGQTSHCMAMLQAASDLAVRAALASVQAGLDQAKAVIMEREQAERTACLEALESLLIRHDFPDTVTSLRLQTNDGAFYTAFLDGCTPFGLRWTLELDPTGDPAFERVVRVDRLVQRLEIHAPRVSGWLHRSPRLRLLRLEHHYLAELELTKEGMKLFLSSESNGRPPGIRLDLAREAPFAHARQSDAADGEPFVLEGSDLELLRTLHERLLAAAQAATTRRKRLLAATLDEVSLLEQPSPRVVAERLIGAIAPITRAIVEHSYAQGELVLKKGLDGNRREEIFVSRAELLARLAPLSASRRSLFGPLGLEEPPSATPHDKDGRYITKSWVSRGEVVSDGTTVLAMGEAQPASLRLRHTNAVRAFTAGMPIGGVRAALP
jgi:hypothetical protein